MNYHYAKKVLNQELDHLINSPLQITEKEKLERECEGGLSEQKGDIEKTLMLISKNPELDKDTQAIIDGMCQNTGKTREQAILALVEFGMVAMQAAIAPNFFLYNKQKKIMKVIYNVVNADEDLKKTAEAYQAYWALDV